MTKILKCQCQHEYQDMKYGNGMRVCNVLKGNSSPKNWRCTVCSKVQSK